MLLTARFSALRGMTAGLIGGVLNVGCGVRGLVVAVVAVLRLLALAAGEATTEARNEMKEG